MEEWHQTGCVLCAQNCGLKLKVENNKIIKVHGDKDNPRSEGYVCRKGSNIAFHQHNADRLTHPLKRVGDSFEKISWDQAFSEIGERLKNIVKEHGPRSFAYMGGGGQGGHMEAAFGVRLMRGLGSRYHYNALSQELTGHFWSWGRALGKQYLSTLPDEEHTDVLVAWGWNGMQSHQMVQAPKHLKRIARDPDKLLVVIDPRVSETAAIADIHLPLRPGTDSLLLRAMIAIILQEGWQDDEYIKNHVSGFDKIKPWFKDFNARAALEVCELEFDSVFKLCKSFSERKWSMHPDLGSFMGRHSTVNSYLQIILLAICGRIGVPGGNIVPGTIMPLTAHSDERQERTWRTVETDFPAICGLFPPNVFPEEVLSDKPERLRAVLVSGSNPLRSYADTTAFEKAYEKLELSVTIEIAMSETALLSDYVLPALSGYESWDTSFFTWTYPEVFLQLRRPVIKPEGDLLENGEIITRIADAVGLIPEIPDSLYEAAKKDRLTYGMELMQYASTEPEALRNMPFILAKTLGGEMGSAHKAAFWGMFQMTPKQFARNAKRAGFETGPMLGEEVFKIALENPQGFWVGKVDDENNLANVRHEDGKIDIYIPEVEDWVRGIDADSEKKALEPDGQYPLILNAGKHSDKVANTLMRNPKWNEGKRDCTLNMNPEDASILNLEDGQQVRITTEAGEETVELEITDMARKGQVILPHGFGLKYQGKSYGANANRLAKNTNRDRLAGTPLHRFIPCRVEAV
jgi:anaerobic selenocysteine-containing dehydrogenase